MSGSSDPTSRDGKGSSSSFDDDDMLLLQSFPETMAVSCAQPSTCVSLKLTFEDGRVGVETAKTTSDCPSFGLNASSMLPSTPCDTIALLPGLSRSDATLCS